jgi:HD superfamily phosphodiesterase
MTPKYFRLRRSLDAELTTLLAARREKSKRFVSEGKILNEAVAVYLRIQRSAKDVSEQLILKRIIGDAVRVYLGMA